MKFLFSKTQPKSKSITMVVLAEQEENETHILADGRKRITIGIGKIKDMNRRKLILTARKVISYAKTNRIKRLAFNLYDFKFRKATESEEDLAELLATNFEMANFDFVKYKTKPKKGWNTIDTVTVIGSISQNVKRAFGTGKKIGCAVNACRELANTPGGEMTPRLLSVAAKKAVRGNEVKVKILREPEIRRLKMGGILGVAKGSVEKPRFIIMEYRGGKKKEKPIVLIGKGVTFDTGGLNLKPAQAIYEMHMDMSGGAAVIHTITLAAQLKLKENIIGLIPAVENMPSGSSYRPGDVIKTMSGKTIEVLNTDAEGRIILADALTYAKQYAPRIVIDIATLTGAALIALGQRASAILTKHETLAQSFIRFGEISGDYVWPLPLWDEYESEIKGTFADIANVGKSRYGGAIEGGMFLYQFAKDLRCPWVHIDIAPRMTATEDEYISKGAAGAPVRLLTALLRNHAI